MDVKRSIKRLDPDVISKIAAGEIIKRPANAVKEMIENSLDAGSTSIQVLVKNGGMKFLQITDNGSGIEIEDFDLVCERYATSKMVTVDDLHSLNTYGFRGEALASISQIAYVSMRTKTTHGRCGYEVSFVEGKMKNKPVPCGANKGTQITVENLFYNVPLRQKILKNFNEEYKRIWDVVARYAVHNVSVGFALKKYGLNDASIKTPQNSSTRDVINLIFGADIACNLLETEGSDETLQINFKISATHLNYCAPQFTFILFINHRLVKTEGLQKDVSELYSIYLPRKKYPFVYISLIMAPGNIDVNVHPAKETVFYLHEEYINKKIIGALQKLILGNDALKTYQEETISLSQGASAIPHLEKRHRGARGNEEEKVTETEPCADNNDGADVTAAVDSNSALSARDVILLNDNVEDIEDTAFTGDVDNSVEIEHEDNELDSYVEFTLDSLKKSMKDFYDQELKSLLDHSTFITCPDYHHMLIRKEDKLYVCHLRKFCQELFYQRIINNFGNLGELVLSEPAPLKRLLHCALSNENSSLEDLPSLHQQLVEKRTILKNHYSIRIDEKEQLASVPMILKNYFPSKRHLPAFILRLARNVSWNNQSRFVHEVCKEIALYYSIFPFSRTSVTPQSEWNSFVESTLFVNIKKYLLPSKELYSNNVIEICDISSFRIS